MSSNGMIRFEEGNYDDLVEKFIEKYRSKWEDFISEKYADSYADSIDHAKKEGENSGR